MIFKFSNYSLFFFLASEIIYSVMIHGHSRRGEFSQIILVEISETIFSQMASEISETT